MAMVIVGTLLGMTVRSPDAVTGVAFVGRVPVDVPQQRVRATRNPALRPARGGVLESDQHDGHRDRHLFGNPTAPTSHSVWTLDHAAPIVAISCILMILVFSPLALRRFERRTAD